MSDDLPAYFSRIDEEKEARIVVYDSEGKRRLPYDAVMRLSVGELARHSIALFGRTLVVGVYACGYRATWAPHCTEIGQTFAGDDDAGTLLRAAYGMALQEQGFHVATPMGGMSGSSRGGASGGRERLRHEP